MGPPWSVSFALFDLRKEGAQVVPQATKPGQPALVMDEARPVVYVALHSTRRHLLAIALATCIALGATPCLLFDHAWLRAAKCAAHVEDNACKPSP